VWKSFFLLAGALLFDEKIYQSGAKAVFLTLVAHPNLPPVIIFGLHIFRRPVCRTTGRLDDTSRPPKN
jgi:hypothetical protein